MDGVQRLSGACCNFDRCRLWYVYFLELQNGDVYVGSTNDLRLRIKKHNGAHVKSTRAFLPAKLLSYVAVEGEKRARTLERYFKSGSGKAFAFKRLVNRKKALRTLRAPSENQ